MKHQFIFFYGSSPGAGKSTLSSRLNQQLSQHNLPVHWIYEDDVLHLEHFIPVVECVQGRSELDLLAACMVATESLVTAYINMDTTVVADSILPYTDWLLAAGIDDLSIAEFSQQLWQLLEPMNPLLIYLQADIATALKRAVDYRGQAWLERSIPNMNTWGANQAQPLRDLADVIAYSERMHKKKVELFSEWKGEILWLDSASHSLEFCVTTMLEYLCLEPSANQEYLPSYSLATYAGQYIAADDESLSEHQTLTVSVKDSELWVDPYWPNGCRLVAEAMHTFRLQDTSHWIQFVEPTIDNPRRLTYHHCGRRYRYLLDIA